SMNRSTTTSRNASSTPNGSTAARRRRELEYGEGMSISDRIRAKTVRFLSDNHYILKTTTFEWRRNNGEWQTQHRESYDRGNGAALLPYNVAGRAVVLVKQFRYPAMSTAMMIS